MESDAATSLWSVGEAERYEAETYGRGLSGWALRRSHALLERPFDQADRFSTVLEVGAGQGTHLPYVRHDYDAYVLTDAHDAMLAGSAANVALARHPDRVRVERQDASALCVPDASADRLIASHVLEHLTRPERVLDGWARVVRPGGTISVLLPCDPGLAWRAGRAFGPRRAARARGLAYDYVMALEHVNPTGNLVAILRHRFGRLEERWWPLGTPSVDANLFYAAHAVVT